MGEACGGNDGERRSGACSGEQFSLSRVALSTLVIAAIVALAYAVARVQSILLFVFFSMVVAIVLHHPIKWLSRWLPRALAAVVTLLALAALVAGLVLLVLPPLEDQAARLVEQGPAALDRVQQWLRQAGGKPGGLGGSLRTRAGEEIGRLLSQALPVVMAIVGGALTALAVVVVAFFMAVNPRIYLNGLLRLVPRAHMKEALLLLRRMGETLRRWTVGTLIAMAVVGTLTGLGLLLVGIDTWLVLGVLSFFGEFIPFLGPVLFSIPGIAMGLAVSPSTGLWAAAVYLVVQQLENHLLQPVIMRRALRAPPALLLVWQLVAAAVFGLPGLLVATPMLAVGEVAIERLYVHRALGKRERTL
jgi:predicted PurR-regulated permease PerM